MGEIDNKMLAARDTILAYLMKEEFDIKQAETVLKMCKNEIEAAVKRMNIREVRKENE